MLSLEQQISLLRVVSVYDNDYKDILASLERLKELDGTAQIIKEAKFKSYEQGVKAGEKNIILLNKQAAKANSPHLMSKKKFKV